MAVTIVPIPHALFCNVTSPVFYNRVESISSFLESGLVLRLIHSMCETWHWAACKAVILKDISSSSLILGREKEVRLKAFLIFINHFLSFCECTCLCPFFFCFLVYILFTNSLWSIVNCPLWYKLQTFSSQLIYLWF